MAKKADMNKVIEKYKPMLKKFGSEVGVAAKKGEENVVMMSKLLKIQLDVLGITLQREKLYHDIGREVAKKLLKGTFEIEGFDKYKKQLEKMQADGEKKKQAISKVKKSKKGKKS